MKIQAVVATVAAVLCAGMPLPADTLGAAFSSEYTFSYFSTLPLSRLGGVLIDPSNPNYLLIGASAASQSGAIYEVGLSRDPITHQITGLSGSPTFYASAPDIDGGLAFAPNGDLLFTQYPDNTIGELRPGSTTPDIYASPLPAIQASVGGMTFIPAGFGGAGNAVFTSYNHGTVCESTPSLNAQSEYNFGVCGSVTIPGVLEQILYVPVGTTGFASNSVLVATTTGQNILVQAYQVDAAGLPIAATATTFFTGSLNEGIAFDSVSGDFVLTSYNQGSTTADIYVISPIQATAPEPGSLLLCGLATAVLLLTRLRLFRQIIERGIHAALLVRYTE